MATCLSTKNSCVQSRAGVVYLPIVSSRPWPVRWIFATGASLAPLVYEILPAGPGKLLNELHIAEIRQLVGAYVLEGEERRIETADQIACTGWLFGHGGGPLEREVLEHGPEYGVAEDMGMAQVGAAAGNGRSRHLQFALVRVFAPFDVCHRVLRNEQDEHKGGKRDSAPCDADRQEHQKKRGEVPEGNVETIPMVKEKS